MPMFVFLARGGVSNHGPRFACLGFLFLHDPFHIRVPRQPGMRFIINKPPFLMALDEVAGKSARGSRWCSALGTGDARYSTQLCTAHYTLPRWNRKPIPSNMSTIPTNPQLRAQQSSTIARIVAKSFKHPPPVALGFPAPAGEEFGRARLGTDMYRSILDLLGR